MGGRHGVTRGMHRLPLDRVAGYPSSAVISFSRWTGAGNAEFREKIANAFQTKKVIRLAQGRPLARSLSLFATPFRITLASPIYLHQKSPMAAPSTPPNGAVISIRELKAHCNGCSVRELCLPVGVDREGRAPSHHARLSCMNQRGLRGAPQTDHRRGKVYRLSLDAHDRSPKHRFWGLISRR